MSTKKKLASKSADGKSAADKGPQPLLKLKFEKFPEKQVAVYFDKTERVFYAEFGFERYESPSVDGLEQKIKAAIKAGATPEPQWTPVIAIEFYPDRKFQGGGLYRTTGEWELAVDRVYVTVKKGKVLEVGWNVSANKRTAEAHELSNWEKLKGLSLPLRSDDETWDHKMLIAYNEQIFRALLQMQKAINGIFDDLGGALRVGKLPAWWPQANKPAPKAAAVKKADPRQPAGTMSDAQLRAALRPTHSLWTALKHGATDAEIMHVLGEVLSDGGFSGPDFGPIYQRGGRKPALWLGFTGKGKPHLEGAALIAEARRIVGIPADNSKQPLLPLYDAAQKPVVTGTLGKGVLPQADFAMLDLVIDLPAGPVPAEMLAAAGFPPAATATKEKDGDFIVNLPRQPGDLSTSVGHSKWVPRAEMQKLIRDRINGQRGAKPKKAAQTKKPALGKSLDSIRDDVKQGSGAPGKKKQASRGDHSAREHLVVKYQGKTLTLGHGPLGNYLVEALRKTYPTIHSAFCLKDNRVQISLQGVSEPLVIPGKAFETAINTAININTSPARGVGSLESFLSVGRNAQAAVDEAIAKATGQGAIAKLHELVDTMEPEDPPVQIPSVILVAAGFAETAVAEIHSPDEIIVRDRKKAPPQFLNLHGLEERIALHAAGVEPEKDLVTA